MNPKNELLISLSHGSGKTRAMTEDENATLLCALKSKPSDRVMRRIQHTMEKLRKEGVPMIDIQVQLIMSGAAHMASTKGVNVAAGFLDDYARILRERS